MTAPALSRKQRHSIVASKRSKVALWVGAVSAGKTIASLFALFFAIRRAKGAGLIVIVGKTLQTIERNIIGPMQDPALFGVLAKQVVHTRGASTATILGREVHLVGANDARSEEKIRGSTIELAYVDEATLLPVGFWEMLLTRLRVAGARLLATTNPGSSQHWLRINYMLAAEFADQMVVFHFTMDDNPLYFPGGDPGPSYIAEMKASFTGVFYQRFIEGKWTNAEGAIYDGWDPSKHVIEWSQMPPMYRLLACAMDFGTQHATSVGILGLGYDRRLYLVDELRIEATTTVERAAPSVQAKMIAAWLKQPHLPENNGLRPEELYADPAGLAWRQELRESEGLDTAAAENSVEYGIGLVSSLLARGLLKIADRCTGVIKEFPDYAWNPKKSEIGIDEPIKERDDSMDMLRYVVASSENEWRDEVGPRPIRF